MFLFFNTTRKSIHHRHFRRVAGRSLLTSATHGSTRNEYSLRVLCNWIRQACFNPGNTRARSGRRRKSKHGIVTPVGVFRNPPRHSRRAVDGKHPVTPRARPAIVNPETLLVLTCHSTTAARYRTVFNGQDSRRKPNRSQQITLRPAAQFLNRML